MIIKPSQRQSSQVRDANSLIPALHRQLSQRYYWQRRLLYCSVAALVAALLGWLLPLAWYWHALLLLLGFAAGFAYPLAGAEQWALAWIQQGSGLSYQTAWEMRNHGGSGRTDPYGFGQALQQRALQTTRRLEPPRLQPWWLPLLALACVLVLLPSLGLSPGSWWAGRVAPNAKPPAGMAADGSRDDEAARADERERAEAPPEQDLLDSALGDDAADDTGDEAAASADSMADDASEDAGDAGQSEAAAPSQADSERLADIERAESGADSSEESAALSQLLEQTDEAARRNPFENPASRNEDDAASPMDADADAADTDAMDSSEGDSGQEGDDAGGFADSELAEALRQQDDAPSADDQAEAGEGDDEAGTEEGSAGSDSDAGADGDEQAEAGEDNGTPGAQSDPQSDQGQGDQDAPGEDSPLAAGDGQEDGQGAGDAASMAVPETDDGTMLERRLEFLPGQLEEGRINPVGEVLLPGSEDSSGIGSGALPGFDGSVEEAISEGRIPAEYQEILRNYFR